MSAKIYIIGGKTMLLGGRIANAFFPSAADSEAPTKPIIAEVSKSASHIEVSVSGSVDNVMVAGYNIYLDGDLAGSTATNLYTIIGLAAATEYSITAKAVDGAGNESAVSNVLSVTTSPGGALAAPTNLQATAQAGGTASLTWSPAANAAGYRIYLECQEPGYDMYGYHYKKTVSGTSANLGYLGSMLAWNVRVVAVSGTGEESLPSNVAGVVTNQAATVYATEYFADGAGPWFDHEFNNPVGRADPINDDQHQAVHIWHDSNQGTPLVFEHCTFRSKDYGLFSDISGANIIIRNCVFLGVNPGINGGTPGKHIHAWQSRQLVFENNICFGFRGVWVNEGQTNGNYAVQNNMFFDIAGLRSDGGTGWKNDADPNYENTQANMMADLDESTTVNVRWNYVYSRPRWSKIEDAFSMFGVKGTAGSRKEWRGNCVNGRYDRKNLEVNTGSGTAFQIESDTRYVDMVENVVVSCGGNAWSTSWAKFIRWYDNRLVSRPYIPGENTQIGFHWRGLQLGNEFWSPTNNPVTDSEGYDNYIWYPRALGGNTVGYSRNDMLYIRPDATNTSESNNTVLDFAPMPTHDQEAETVEGWWDYIRAQGQVVGPKAA